MRVSHFSSRSSNFNNLKDLYTSDIFVVQGAVVILQLAAEVDLELVALVKHKFVDLRPLEPGLSHSGLPEARSDRPN